MLTSIHPQVVGTERVAGDALALPDVEDAARSELRHRHFRKALEDIAAVSPDSIGVFVVGDLTDGGTDAEYETCLALVRDFGSRLPPFHAVAGNHDLTGPLGRFLQAKEDGLLLVRGRDFDGGLWLPSAQFIVEPATRR